jgi:hypothetical protein
MISADGAAVRFPHRWTPGGVTVEADFTGGHLLHLAAAGCVLNDVHREAATLGIGLQGVRVTAVGGFDAATWQSAGIDYSVEVSSDAQPINSPTFSRSWTRWPRSRRPSGPEPPSGGLAEPDPSGTRKRLPAMTDQALAAAEACVRITEPQPPTLPSGVRFMAPRCGPRPRCPRPAPSKARGITRTISQIK